MITPPNSNLQRPRKEPHGELEAGWDQTPVMEETDLERASELSLKTAKPPLRVPGYEQEQFLGRGAFGEVWKAVDSNSGRLVAIKFYNHRGGLDWSHMTREVEKLQYLFSDRHVVQLFDVGWDADPPYYVMEYMAYGSLEDRLRASPMTVAEAVRMIREIALGLAHAHGKGILHCDLKPGNIMLDQDGKPRLADFGQARLRHEHAPALGTLFYMAPEQADLSAAPDARWDVYAIGAILYRMITGELPYLTDAVTEQLSSQDSLEERLKSYKSVGADPQQKPIAHRLHPGVDKTLADLIDGCLEFNPHERFPNVQAVLHALEVREHRKSQRPMLLLGVVGPALAVLLMALAGWMLFSQTLHTASSHLLERTGESNHFAAKSVAERFSLEIDKRWNILEEQAASPAVARWLIESKETNRDALQKWLEQQHAKWNSHFREDLEAAYWFVLDRQGKVQAISPYAESLIGSYFGYREYFHGQSKELSPYEPVPATISAPHRSNVFRSQPSNHLAVAFSVPISSPDGASLGVLAMETEMGHFAEFAGSRNQLAVLLDLKQDQKGVRGLIVEHPTQEATVAERSFYLASEQLIAIQSLTAAQLRGRTLEQADFENPSASKFTLADYQDPVTPDVQGGWLASVAPVEVSRGGTAWLDTHWAILIQEQQAQILSPLERLRGVFLYGGLAALTVAALIVAAMWWLVLTVANAPGKLRSLRFWVRTSTLHTHTASLRSTPSNE